MKYQAYGADKYISNVSINARNVGGNLEITVSSPDGREDGGYYNGLYYSAPAASIKSLTIRGTDDNETISFVGDLGIGGAIFVEGGGGSDELLYDDGAAPTVEHHYTFDFASKGDGWDQRMNRGVAPNATSSVKTIPQVDFKGISKFTLVGSPGNDTVRVEQATNKLSSGLFIDTRGGPDKIYVGSTAPSVGMSAVNAFVLINGGAGGGEDWSSPRIVDSV